MPRAIDFPAQAAAQPQPDALLARAWALKDACHAAWSSDPRQVAGHAEALQALVTEACAGGGVPARVARECELQGLAAWTAGLAELTRGRMQDAVDRLDEAETAFRSVGLARPAAQTQVPRIMALAVIGQYDAASRCAEAAQRELRALGDTRTAAKVGLNLGAMLERQGDAAGAARHSRTAAVLFARVGDTEHSVMADINLANALTSMGEVDEALRIHARAHMRAGAHGYPVLQALVDEAVSLVRLSRGQYREALAGLEAARRAYERLDMPQHLAVAEKQLADAYLELRLLPEALALFDRALERLATLDVPDEQAWTLAQRGRARALSGASTAADGDFAQAEALFVAQDLPVGQAAVALARAELSLVSGDSGPAVAQAQRAAEAFDRVGQAEGRVRADLLGALALLAQGDLDGAGDGLATTAQAAARLQLPAVEVRCRVGQGLLSRHRGDRAAARAAFEDAIARFEVLRSALPGDDLRGAFLADHLQPYQAVLQLALEAHDREPGPAQAAAVLEQLERVRARGLLERVHAESLPADDAAVQALRQRLSWLHRRIQRLQDEGDSAAVLLDERRRFERELLEHARRARLAAPGPEATGAAAQGRFQTAALQAALRADEALVEFALDGDELLACVVTPETVTLHRRVATAAHVLSALRDARFQIESLRHGHAPVLAHLPMLTARATRRLQQLHALMIAPLAPRLAPCRRLLIVPCGPLAGVPFAALHDGVRPLSQQVDLALAPSAQLALRGLVRQASRPRRALALGETSRLQHAGLEAEAVAAMFPRGQAHVGAEACVDRFTREAPGADVIHLACHAQFRTDNAMFSALQLRDGPLSVERIEGLTLQPGTVVLSACETGLSATAAGDEQVGLVRAFLAAGAARVVASLWPVDDVVTAEFMRLFYGALGTGQAPATALRQAQTALRQRYPHPFHWAAFALHGGW